MGFLLALIALLKVWVGSKLPFFSTIGDIDVLVRSIFFAEAEDPWINAKTVKYFVTAKNLTQSSRALGTNEKIKNETVLPRTTKKKTKRSELSFTPKKRDEKS